MSVPSNDGYISSYSQLLYILFASTPCSLGVNFSGFIAITPYFQLFQVLLGIDAVVRTACACQKCTTFTKLHSFFKPFRFRLTEASYFLHGTPRLAATHSGATRLLWLLPLGSPCTRAQVSAGCPFYIARCDVLV